MEHDKFCRFANDNREFKHDRCFDCQRLDKARQETKEQIAKEIEDLLDPPPIDDVDFIVWNVIEKCASVARGTTSPR